MPTENKPKTFTFEGRLGNSNRRRDRKGNVQATMSFIINPEQMKDRLDDMVEMLNITHFREPKMLEDLLAPRQLGQKHKIDSFHCAAKNKIYDVKFAGEEVPGFGFIDSLVMKIKEDKEGNPVYKFLFCGYLLPVEETAAFEIGFLNYQEEVPHPKNPDRMQKKLKWFPITFTVGTHKTGEVVETKAGRVMT